MFTYPWGICEDDLTGDLFGLMKYLPAEALLAPFVGLIQSLYPDRNINPQNIEGSEILLWPEYEIPKEWQEQFNLAHIPLERRRRKYYIVPDVVIRFDDYTFIVEAEKSHSVEAEQLFQQYLIGQRQFLTPGARKRRLFNLLINTDQMRPYSCHIGTPDNSISPSDSIPQYIKKRSMMLDENYNIDEITNSFLWISWHHIGKLAEEVLDGYKNGQDEVSRTISRFLLGLKEMMDKEGFYPVRVFCADDPNEVRVEDYASISVLKILPRWQDLSPGINPELIPSLLSRESSLECDLIDFEEKIDTSNIPVFRLLPDLANWPIIYYIQPESIRILNKGGN